MLKQFERTPQSQGAGSSTTAEQEPPGWVLVGDEIAEAISRFPTLDYGKAQAISLALQLSASVIPIDERRARQAAEAGVLTVSGTLGVLGDAQRPGHAMHFSYSGGCARQTSSAPPDWSASSCFCSVKLVA